MNSRERTIRTETATITLVADRFIEQRILPTARLTTAAMEKCRKARRSVSRGIPCVVLIVVPDTVPVESEAANVDHYRQDSVDRSIIAMALVVSNSSTSALNKFYFRYYPQAFQVRVLDSEDDARNWLNERLREDQTERIV